MSYESGLQKFGDMINITSNKLNEKLPRFKEDDCAMLHGLQMRPDLNWVVGRLGKFDEDLNRWAFLPMINGVKCDGIRVKPQNILWICDANTYDNGGKLKTGNMLSSMVPFMNSYDDLPAIDINNVASQICAKYAGKGLEFEDHTHAFEELQETLMQEQARSKCQIDFFRAMQPFLNAGLEACAAKGKKGILIRRTKKNTAMFATRSTFESFTSSVGVKNRIEDFVFYISEDYVQINHGSQLQEKLTHTCILEVVEKIVLGQSIVCSVCLDDIDDHLGNLMTECGHSFHIKCLAEWAASDSRTDIRRICTETGTIHVEFSCPTCRHQVSGHLS